MCTYIPTYLPACLPTYLPTYIPTLLHSYIPTFLHPYIPTFLHSCIPAFLHSYIPTFLHSYIPTFLHSCIPACLHSCISAFLHSCIPAFLHSCIPTYLHAYVPTYARTYIHIICIWVCCFILACTHLSDAFAAVGLIMHVDLHCVWFTLAYVYTICSYQYVHSTWWPIQVLSHIHICIRIRLLIYYTFIYLFIYIYVFDISTRTFQRSTFCCPYGHSIQKPTTRYTFANFWPEQFSWVRPIFSWLPELDWKQELFALMRH